tara:strand:+ start:6123 stop:6224 length:102 start_codon:yes stop_codon:yes gene_type:complete
MKRGARAQKRVKVERLVALFKKNLTLSKLKLKL